MSFGGLSIGIIVGISASLVMGVLLTICAIAYINRKCKQSRVRNGGSENSAGGNLPIRVNGFHSSAILSDLNFHSPEPRKVNKLNYALCWRGRGLERKSVLSNSGLPSYSYRDLERATNNFSTSLGEGAFGLVYKATLPSGITVAVKVLSSKSNQGEREFLTEVMLLGRLHHKNLVNLVGYCTEKNHRILIYQFMENGSLAQHLYGENSKTLSWSLRVQIAQDISKGIEYLHEGASPPIIHRDIKSSNVLLDGSMQARVADFGLSKEANNIDSNSSVQGTLGYVDPEYILTRKLTEKSDVYSFGILLFELITARNPQQGLLDYVNLAKISVEADEGWEEILDARLNGECNIKEVGAMADLANRCLEKLPMKRPAMREAVQTLASLGKRLGGSRSSRQTPRSPRPSSVGVPPSAFRRSIGNLERLASISET